MCFGPRIDGAVSTVRDGGKEVSWVAWMVPFSPEKVSVAAAVGVLVVLLCVPEPDCSAEPSVVCGAKVSA